MLFISTLMSSSDERNRGRWATAVKLRNDVVNWCHVESYRCPTYSERREICSISISAVSVRCSSVRWHGQSRLQVRGLGEKYSSAGQLSVGSQEKSTLFSQIAWNVLVLTAIPASPFRPFSLFVAQLS